MFWTPFLLFFQNKDPDRYVFYKVCLAYKNLHEPLQFCSPDPVAIPEDIINLIIKYLSPKDLINLYVSKIFSSTLFTMPLFWKTMNNYFQHNILKSLLKSDSLFLNRVFYPILYNNNFYFAVDTVNIKQCPPHYYPIQPFAAIFNHIKNIFNFKSSLRLLDTSCPTKCACLLFVYSPVNFCTLPNRSTKKKKKKGQ